MKRSRFSEEQIISMLKEQEAGMPTADVCRKHGVSSATFYKYKAKYGGLEVSDARRLRALGTRRPMLLPDAPNIRWSLDFVSDALTDGHRFRVLAVVDDYSRECLALVADTSLSGHRVVRELDAVIARRGRPAMVASDNGTELASMAILSWCQRTGIEWHYIAPASRCKTASWKASTGASGTNC